MFRLTTACLTALLLSSTRLPAQAPDTATVRLQISKMTCGGCATAARLALRRLAGVHSAQVSYDDSLGIVRYDPKRLTPAQITEHLTRMTGFPATVLPDTTVRQP